MKLNKRIILVIIILLLLLALLIILIYIKTNKKQESKTVVEETPVDMYAEYMAKRAAEGITASDANAERVDSINEYYTIKSIIDKFNTNINYLNATADSLDLIVSKENEQKVLQQYKQIGIDYINDVLAQNYKTKYEVDNIFIYNSLAKFSGVDYTIDSMYVVKDSSFINTFFIFGRYNTVQYNYIVVLDRYNFNFEIYLDNFVKEGNYSQEEIFSMKTLNINKVEANENNKFKFKSIEKEQEMNMYFEDYMNLLNIDLKKAYTLLDSSYSKKRFESYEDFVKYVKSLNEEDRLVYDYVVDGSSSNKIIICKTNYNEVIVFKVTGVMNYSVYLDSYTTSIYTYENEYNKATEDKKLKMCINTYFECINNKDYKTAYKYLNEGYKELNFPTFQEFEQYAKNNFFDYNIYTSYEAEKDENNTYTVNGTINDLEADGDYEAEIIEKNLFVKLGTNYNNFEISFVK